MGALHKGHLSLIDMVARRCDDVVVSVFVNPSQFAEGEDLAAYPRDLAADTKACERAGVRVLFAPDASQMYAADDATRITVGNLSQALCGSRRPGHFSGVCTVVTKLFNIVGPCVAAFGEKDYQQLQVVRQMVRDLHQPVKVIAAPIVREADGLAMSSRNAYLTSEQRAAAPVIHDALCKLAADVDGGEVESAQLIRKARATIERVEHARVDYIELCDARSLQPVQRVSRGATLAAAAVFFGSTRLIDNVLV